MLLLALVWCVRLFLTPIMRSILAKMLHAHYRHSEPEFLGFLLHSLILGTCATIVHFFTLDSEEATTKLGTVAFAARFLAVYLMSMSASVLAYRLSPFHPLAAFPGPKSAAASKWWSFYQVAARGRRHINLQRYASEYASYMS